MADESVDIGFSVRDVLEVFDSDFAPVADAVANGEYALWVGSGISRQAPNLGNLIERAIDFIRQRALDPDTSKFYLPALNEALSFARITDAEILEYYKQPLAEWPKYKEIIDRLWDCYSRILDIRIAGEAGDFILWEAINIREAFRNPSPPAAEHLCIAILILEGAVNEIASANWDGFIESAVARLSKNVQGVMQVVVDPDQLRGRPGQARLLKFHGCILHAEREPELFRRFLTGSYTQITGWVQNPDFSAMYNTVVNTAATKKTLVLGLSIQDSNLQSIFTQASRINPWCWPCAPQAPAHVFCEELERLPRGQRDVLSLVYREQYNVDPAALEKACHIPAWGEKVLIALVLNLLSVKLKLLIRYTLIPLNKLAIADELMKLVDALRDDVSDLAVANQSCQDRTEYVNTAIILWSRVISIFRTGTLPANEEAYEILTTTRPHLIENDHNSLSMGLGFLGVALSLLEHGQIEGLWSLREPASFAIESGAMTARALRSDGSDRPVFIVKSATEAIILQSGGAFDGQNVVVIHADNAWFQMNNNQRRVRSAPGRIGRVKETHVSLTNLIVDSDTCETLKNQFVSEVMI